MDIIKVMETIRDQEACLLYLEHLRWAGSSECLHCGSERVRRRVEHKEKRVGLWNCYECRSAFKVTCDTVFHGTKTPLQKWFVAIALMANAKKSLSSHQLARDLGVKQKTAWRIMKVIRAEMEKGLSCYKEMAYETPNRSKAWGPGEIHTSTIDGNR